MYEVVLSNRSNCAHGHFTFITPDSPAAVPKCATLPAHLLAVAWCTLIERSRGYLPFFKNRQLTRPFGLLFDKPCQYLAFSARPQRHIPSLARLRVNDTNPFKVAPRKLCFVERSLGNRNLAQVYLDPPWSGSRCSVEVVRESCK